MDRILTVDGFFVPRAVPPDVKKCFAESDCIIAKGTGSYEALSAETGGKTSIFMLKVKCGPIARQTGIDEGNMVIRLDQGEMI